MQRNRVKVPGTVKSLFHPSASRPQGVPLHPALDGQPSGRDGSGRPRRAGSGDSSHGASQIAAGPSAEEAQLGPPHWVILG
jgi:hypothetical protein